MSWALVMALQIIAACATPEIGERAKEKLAEWFGRMSDAGRSVFTR